MIDRFQLYVILRTQVSDREARRRYLAVEAVMEALAARVGLDPTLAGLTGLGACADVQLARANPDRRGEVAEEFLLTEGVPAEAATAVRQCFRELDVARLSDLAALLAAVEGLVDAIYEELAHASLDDLRVAGPASVRALECLDRLGLDAAAAAAAAVEAMRAIRGDLRL